MHKSFDFYNIKPILKCKSFVPINANRNKDIWLETDRQTDRRTDGHRQTDRRTDRDRETETERQKQRERETEKLKRRRDDEREVIPPAVEMCITKPKTNKTKQKS